ncbi:glycosyltransferase family 2 protein [Wenyingzhuangia marina]|uniref:Glycosyltransferase 2-like domain-containing protein n=1 Tax=Wenyingzhuangia marina TaxID=1195760 RepID=A0A1M5UAH0_9FLAO|nr:glycosyltransferase family 2 protein [Wenyingzhuangia marina]GGF68764.1 glycosyl transferase [Wenyingzhuangia marina]SHH59846.1 hypothetical protein SAMN05444281_1127 [Wenyingzhuangia marina]
MKNLLVSIIIPCYNQAEFLCETLESVLNQKYIHWECFIVNDGSTDDTEVVAKEYCNKDPRFVYLYKNNGGLSSARNYGLNHAKGDLIQFLDSDDLLFPTKIVESIALFKGDHHYKFVITDFSMLINNVNYSMIINQEKLTFEGVLYYWDFEINIPIHCGLFDASFFTQYRFDETIKAKEDWLMWIVLFKQGYIPIALAKPLVSYRKHTQSMTMATNIFKEQLRAIEIIKEIIGTNLYEEFLLILYKNISKKNSVLKQEIENLKSSVFYKVEKKLKKIFRK